MLSSKQNYRVGLGAIAIAALTLTACTGKAPESSTTQPVASTQIIPEAKAPKTTGVQIDGSSTVYPISEAVAKAFKTTPAGQQAQIDVQFSGTSAGFRKFCAGETDISNASRPILVTAIEACTQAGVFFIELPIAFDALTLAVNPQNTWAKEVTMAELRKIWEPAAEGKITNWKQIQSSYPNQPLKLFGAGKDSGTFDYFNEVVNGDPKQSRMDYTASEDDNVLVEGIARESGALGYIPYVYFESNQNRLQALAIDSGKGPVAPTPETVEKNQYQPFSRPLFIYVNFEAARKPEVRAFVEYYLQNAKNLVSEVGYVPLSAESYRLASVQFQRGEVGTVFEGVPQPDVTLAELLRRQAVFQLASQSK